MTITCVKCEGTGLYLRCRASGRKGFFLKLPPPTAPKCDHCAGSGRCPICEGLGEVPGYVWKPQIFVLSERSSPTSISVACWTGASWRYIHVPSRVIAKTKEEQYQWVGWCVQDHYRDSKGECFLFGKIERYAYRPTREVCIEFDIDGNLIGLES